MNETIFLVNYDTKGYPYIVTTTLAARIREAAELTTSPKGVMTKVYVDGQDLCRWTPSGKSIVIQSYDSEEEAEEAWLEHQYQDYIDSEAAIEDHYSRWDAIVTIADEMETSTDVVESLLHHHDILCQAFSKRKAEEIMRAYYKAKAKANGQMTKALRRAIDRAKYPNCQMFGEGGTSDRDLDVEAYYTEEFKKELRP